MLITTTLACVLLARTETWLPWLRAVIAVAGVGAAVLLLVAGRLPIVITRVLAAVAIVACLAGPAAYSLATATTPHRGVIPSAGPKNRKRCRFRSFDSPKPSAELVTALRADGDRYTWTAAAIGSTNAAGYQLASDTPVMAVGGFNGTDPSPTLHQFQQWVSDKKIHYFAADTTRGPMRGPMRADAARQPTLPRGWPRTSRHALSMTSRCTTSQANA